MAKKTQKPAVNVISLNYELAELPSSQHRAGLAGLVLMVNWLKRQPNRTGICEITRLDQKGATLRTNKIGLSELFDEVYGATREDKWVDKERSDTKTKEVIPPCKKETRVITDPKTGKENKKTYYLYKDVVPRGAFLADPEYDKSEERIWGKQWRSIIWRIIRKKPTTRNPYNSRADGKLAEDAAKEWDALIKKADKEINLPSTYFIGAQEANAEDVPFLDRTRFRFLLNFLPFAFQVYVPSYAVYSKKEKKLETISDGYAIAIPDIARLEDFCSIYPDILRERSEKIFPLKERGKQMFRYHPKDSVIDLAVESGLDVMSRLNKRLKDIAGDQPTRELVWGIDVIHLEEGKNGVSNLGSIRVSPELVMSGEYMTLRTSLWNPTFRRQRILNFVNGSDWYQGFDRLFATLSYEQTINNDFFRHDARESFKYEGENMSEENEPKSEIALIYNLVGNYLNRKLESKHDMKWKEEWKGYKSKDEKPKELKDYEEKREKLAREAFLAIRSRTGQDFIDYFSSTLCSVPQWMNGEEGYIALTKSLLEDTDKIRTLTMLALSARS